MLLRRGRERGDLGEDVAAALRLRADEADVLGARIAGRELARQLVRDERDRRERRAELVRGRGGEPVERREVLLALQDQLGRGERIGELARLLRDAEGVERHERQRADERDPHAADIVQRHLELSFGNQGSGRCTKTSTVAAPSVMAPSRNVLSAGCAVAETMTGPRSRIAKGFSRPPVR